MGATLEAEAAAAGVMVETAKAFKRDDDAKTAPERWSQAPSARRRTARRSRERAVPSDRVQVTDIIVPPADLASDDVKKLKENCSARRTRSSSPNTSPASHSEIGVTINQRAFAVATGAAAAQQ